MLEDKIAYFSRCQPTYRRQAGSTLALCFATLCLAFIGCGGPDFVSVHGIVTFDGQDIESGMIVFEPVDRKGPSAGAKIEQGKYRVSKSDGLPPGEKIVRINSARKTGRKVSAGAFAPQGTMVDELELYLPATYNRASEMRCTLTLGDANQQDFALQSLKE